MMDFNRFGNVKGERSMKTLIRKAVLLMLVTVGLAITDVSAQFLGAEMSYEVGPELVTIRLSVYEGLHINHGTVQSKVKVEGATSGDINYVDLVNIDRKDISPACESTCSRLTNFRCDFEYTVIEYVYEGVLEKSKLNENDCEIAMSWSACCRPNAGINNTLYLESRANVCLENVNSSPRIINDPIAFVPLNRPLTYNFDIHDSNSDSISFELIPSRVDNSTNHTYANNLDYKAPLQYLGFPKKDAAYPRGFHLDKQLHQLKFTPTKLGGNNLAVSVKEYRNGKLIGESVRDIYVHVVSPSNSFPVITGINGGQRDELQFCAGAETSFKIFTEDLDKGDEVELSFTHNLANASIKEKGGKRPHLEVTWTPQNSDIGRTDLYLSVKAEDNSCDLKGLTYRTFNFSVAPKVSADFDHKISSCRKVELKSKSYNPRQKLSHEWRLLHSDVILSSSALNYEFDKFGTYTVELSVKDESTGCESKTQKDITLIPPSQVVIEEQDAVCPDMPFTLQASGASRYVWADLNDSPDLGTQSELEYTTKKDVQLVVFGYDKFNCFTTDTVAITVLNPELNLSNSADVVCSGQHVFIQAHDGENWTWDSDNLVHAAGNRAEYLVNGDLDILVKAKADNGCLVEKTIRIEHDADCVWPGEVNGDLVVNNHDIIPIGLAYGESSDDLVPGAEIDWKPYSVSNWYRNFENGRNIKHADANKDGSIDYLDITIVDAFYQTETSSSSTGKRKTYSGSKLFFEYDTLKRNGKTTYIVSVNLGTEKEPAKDVYGIAFSIKYNSFVPSSSVSFNTKNSWLKSGHTSSNTIQLVKNIPANKTGGKIDVGYSRTNKIPVTGWGQIGVLKFIVDDNIDLKRPGSFVLSMHDYALVDNYGIELDVYDESLEIPFELKTGVYNNLSIHVEVYPNPAKSKLNIALPEGDYKAIYLVNSLGQIIRTKLNPASGIIQIETAGLHGAYFVKVVGKDASSTFPVQIQN